MILVITNKDCYGLSYYEYLQNNNIKSLKVDLRDLIKITVCDSFRKESHKREWLISAEEKIDLTKIKGVYHCLEHLDISLFNDFDERDREYVREEWFAYFVFFLNQIEKNVNPLTHKRYGGSLFSILSVYKASSKFGINIPQYLFGSGLLSTEKNLSEYVAYDDIFNFLNPVQTYENNSSVVLLVEKPKGQPVLIRIIGNEITSEIFEDRDFNAFILSDTDKNNFMMLKNFLGINILEILCLKINNKLILYGISIFPDWKTSHLPTSYYWNSITKFILD